jgi:hypothetical protein
MSKDESKLEQSLTDENVEEFYNAFHDNFNLATKKSPYGDFLLKEIASGKKTLFNKSIRETKIFDDSFIDVLERAYPNFQKIAIDPKKALKYDSEVVQMEKAKRVTSESIRHLASHSQYIKKIGQDGDVIPSKILTVFTDEDLSIYENRFYKTTLNRIVKFLTLRVETMKKNLTSFQREVVEYNNTFNAKDRTYELTCKLNISNELKENRGTAELVLNKVERLLEVYQALKGTPFVKALKNVKEVVPPIMKTNIILHNPYFQVLYNTWIFMESYNNMAYDVEVKEEKYKDDVDVLSDIQLVSTVFVNDMIKHRGINGTDLMNQRKKHLRAPQTKEIDNKEGQYLYSSSNVQMENYQMSEAFLSETRDLYNKSYKELLDDGMSTNMSIRTVYKEMLKVINSIYPRVFKDNYDEVFSSYKEQYENEKQKYNVLKIVCEQKQIDLNKTLKEEEKVLKKLQALEIKAKKEEIRLEKEAKRKALRDQKEALRLQKLEERLIKERIKKEEAQKKEEERKNKELLEKEAREKEESLKQDDTNSLVDSLLDNINDKLIKEDLGIKPNIKNEEENVSLTDDTSVKEKLEGMK